MKYYILMLPILIGSLLLTESAMSADQSPRGNNKRWGITTKEPVEDEEDAQDKIEGIDIDLKNNHKDNLQDKKTPDREEDPGAKASGKNDDTGAENQIKEIKSVEKKSEEERPADTITPGKQSKEQKGKDALIKWKNETQKTQCNGYLASLKESFLKARYYSIQGVPCGTAENARSFMTIINNCKQDCPDGFLKQNGYTTRIIRNLRWLEKLGSERCPEMNSNLPQNHTDEHRHQGKEGDKRIQ